MCRCMGTRSACCLLGGGATARAQQTWLQPWSATSVQVMAVVVRSVLWMCVGVSGWVGGVEGEAG